MYIPRYTHAHHSTAAGSCLHTPDLHPSLHLHLRPNPLPMHHLPAHLQSY